MHMTSALRITSLHGCAPSASTAACHCARGTHARPRLCAALALPRYGTHTAGLGSVRDRCTFAMSTLRERARQTQGKSATIAVFYGTFFTSLERGYPISAYLDLREGTC